ncbi:MULTISPECIES: flavin reductase family protein [Salibacter]|uniref:Flavin reductase family protein n=1 Tax=Salibacter halophilus TaxID=1803916 RepID=A0A6N6M792_9FLAO|nr:MULTISPECIES: flavin reductase family protein [Salibacter]KAB1063824.1 flavin reductase family protein [Salibacter halophilus]MDR9397835.1 flavin reductase family protein [Salibacter sp.]MDR9487082.1 flavin reductase family protein [Salibacter sp.]
MLKVDPKNTETAKLHGYMLGAIAPRPIAFASTIDEDGNPNLSPFSFFNAFGSNPPIAIFSPARRVRNNTTKHTLENAKATGEVVINIVNYPIVEQMSLSSTEYGDGVNEFEKSGLTPIKSELVKPFRVKESPVQLECKVKDIIETGTEGGAGNLIVCEIVMIHINEDVLDENGSIDQQKIDLVARMGGSYYCRASGDALFEIPKPLRSLGIGVDQIPEDIRNSTVLTGNDLGRLGNVDELPDETEVNDYKLTELSDLFVDLQDDAPKLELELHKIAKELLSQGKVEEAWKTLLTFNDR